MPKINHLTPGNTEANRKKNVYPVLNLPTYNYWNFRRQVIVKLVLLSELNSIKHDFLEQHLLLFGSIKSTLAAKFLR